MTGKELKKFLEDHLVPSKLYKIGGRKEKRICMEKSATGWDVFFSEHKQRIGLTHYRDEASACKGMLNEIRKVMELMYGLTWVS